MSFKTFLAGIEAAIREHDVKGEIALAYTEGSYNRTYDGEWTWRLGKLGARVLQGATPLQSVIQWLDGPRIDHTSREAIGEDTAMGVAVRIIGGLRRGF